MAVSGLLPIDHGCDFTVPPQDIARPIIGMGRSGLPPASQRLPALLHQSPDRLAVPVRPHITRQFAVLDEPGDLDVVVHQEALVAFAQRASGGCAPAFSPPVSPAPPSVRPSTGSSIAAPGHELGHDAGQAPSNSPVSSRSSGRRRRDALSLQHLQGMKLAALLVMPVVRIRRVVAAHDDLARRALPSFDFDQMREVAE